MALVQTSFQIKEEEDKLPSVTKSKGGEGQLVLYQNPKGEERGSEGEAFNRRRQRINKEDNVEEEEKEEDEFKSRRRKFENEEDEEEEEEDGNKKLKGYVGTCDWSSEAVYALLDSYSPKFSLGKGFLRGKDWEEVLTDVNYALHSSSKKTMKQCKDKVDSLKRRYKVEKRKAVNGTIVTWPFFNQIDQMMGSVLRQGKLFDPRHEKLSETWDPKPGKLFDSTHGKIFDPRQGNIFECKQGKLLEPYDPRHGKFIEPYDPRQAKLFEPYECRQGKHFEPYDSMQGKLLHPCDSIQANLFEVYDSMQGKLLQTCDSRQGKLFEPYDLRQGQFFDPRLANGFGCDPSAHPQKNAFQNGKPINEERVTEGGVKHRTLVKMTSSAGVDDSDCSFKHPLTQSSSLHQKNATRKRKITVNETKMQLLEDVVTGFSDVFARIEVAKMQIFNKIKLEMAKLHKMKKKHKTSSSNCGSSG